MPLLSSKKTAAILGVHPNTLRAWARDGKIEFERTPTGHRRYNPESVLRPREADNSATGVCYCRVSSSKQKDDLVRQAAELHQIYPEHEVVRDIGSGLSFKRKGLLSVLERVLSGEVKEVVVAHRDRLCRFGFDLLQWIIEKNGGKLMVLHDVSASPQQELVTDLLSILHVFSCRMHGLRKYRNSIKEDKTLSDIAAERDSEEGSGDISACV